MHNRLYESPTLETEINAGRLDYKKYHKELDISEKFRIRGIKTTLIKAFSWVAWLVVACYYAVIFLGLDQFIHIEKIEDLVKAVATGAIASLCLNAFLRK